MSTLVSKTSIFLLCITSLIVVSGCSSRISAGIAPQTQTTPTRTSLAETPDSLSTSTPKPQAGTNDTDSSYDPLPYEQVDDFGEAETAKLSGIVFHPQRQTLFAVRDNGLIFEINTDGTFIQNKKIQKKADFEGITYNPVTELLYVAIEGEDVIVEVDPETLEAQRNIPIDRIFEGDLLLSPDGNGIEGITFVPAVDEDTAGSFFLVNQSKQLGGTDPSIVFEVEIYDAAGEPRARIMRYFSVGVTDLSGIHYVPSSRRLLIISDSNDLLLEVSLTGKVFHTYQLPGKNQEGITTDWAGSLYIVQDTKKMPLKFRPLNQADDAPQKRLSSE